MRVPHKKGILVVSYPPFGPGRYHENMVKMQKTYFHSADLPQISFRPATTSESISAVSFKFEHWGDSKTPQEDKWLQLGYVVRTSEGVFANPPENSKGLINDEITLKSLLNNAEKFNGIYLFPNDFGFAPYETFKQGEQDSEEFARSGLARVLEHTPKKVAKNLKEISSRYFYKNGVCIWNFKEVENPILRGVSLNYNWKLLADDFRKPDGVLVIDGECCNDDYFEHDYGYAFGVFSNDYDISLKTGRYRFAEKISQLINRRLKQ